MNVMLVENIDEKTYQFIRQEKNWYLLPISIRAYKIIGNKDHVLDMVPEIFKPSSFESLSFLNVRISNTFFLNQYESEITKIFYHMFLSNIHCRFNNNEFLFKGSLYKFNYFVDLFPKYSFQYCGEK